MYLYNRRALGDATSLLAPSSTFEVSTPLALAGVALLVIAFGISRGKRVARKVGVYRRKRTRRRQEIAALKSRIKKLRA